jgi:hypothetical protein
MVASRWAAREPGRRPRSRSALWGAAWEMSKLGGRCRREHGSDTRLTDIL